MPRHFPVKPLWKRGALPFEIVVVFGTLVVLLFAFGLFSAKYSSFDKKIGERQSNVIDAYAKGEKALYFLDTAAKNSLPRIIHDLGKSGGGADCGEFYGYPHWIKEDGYSCIPNQDMLSQRIKTGFISDLDLASETYNSHTSTIIPLSNYEIQLSPSPLSLIGMAKSPILIPIGDIIDIPQVQRKSTLLSSVGLIEKKRDLQPVFPSLPSSQAFSSYPSIPAKRIDEILKERGSALVGVGDLLEAAQSRTTVPTSILLAIASTESSLRHCCNFETRDGKKICRATPSLTCDASSILTSTRQSIGFMQINLPVNGHLARSVCREWQTAYDLECNINIGAKLIRDGYFQYQNGIPIAKIERYCKDKEIAATYASYRGWDAALRSYNGLGCDPSSADLAYIDHTKQKIAQLGITTTEQVT